MQNKNYSSKKLSSSDLFRIYCTEKDNNKTLLIFFESIPVHKRSLKSAKNEEFFSFCILVDRPMG